MTRRLREGMILFGAVLFLLLSLNIARAQSSTTDDNSAIAVPADTDECSGNVPSCVTVKTPKLTVPAGKRQVVKVLCGSGSFFWNWTVKASPQLVVGLYTGPVMLSAHPVKDSQNRPLGAVFSLDEQTGTRAGIARIRIGCSTEDPTGQIITRMQNNSVNPTPSSSD